MAGPKRAHWLLTIGGLALVAGIVGLLLLDLPLRHRQHLTFASPDGAPLAATYYPGTAASGVLLLEGFGADQTTLRSVARELVASGVHVFTFDYPGHGRSPGTLAYDNAATDRLAGQVQAATAAFQDVSGLQASEITWMGHSLGARVALQSSVLGPRHPKQLILLGAQINLGMNVQSEFFTGVSDADLDWVQRLGRNVPSVPIALHTGAWEDILTVEGAQLLMTRLCGAPVTVCADPPARKWVLTDALVHNYEIYSPRVLRDVKAQVVPGLETPAARAAAQRIALWVVTVTGLFLTLAGGLALRDQRANRQPAIEVVNPGQLVWAKLWLWAAALPISAVVMALYVLIPLPSPTFNLIYGGFLGGYGVLLLMLYGTGRMPGVSRHLKRPRSAPAPPRGWMVAIGCNLALFAAVTLLYRSGLGLVPPVGARQLWIWIFTPLTALGFWLGALESDALRRAAPEKPAYRFWAMVFGLVPFFLYAALMGALGSISGMIGALTGLLVLILSLMQGEITRAWSGSALLAAISQSLLIYWLILPNGALFMPMVGS
jgi:pimeloyl-ACP methyl ester carboxylesterase